MKVLLVGATGTIGTAIIKELEAHHDIVKVGRSRGELQVDITDMASIRALFTQVGKVDALICAAGNVHFGALGEMGSEQFRIGLNDKLLGQVNLALAGQTYLNDGGSITLTSGSLSHDPILYGANASTVNAAIDGFVRAAAIELPRGLRINSVSPTMLTESLPVYGDYFSGSQGVPAADVARAYRKSVDGRQTGQTYRIW